VERKIWFKSTEGLYLTAGLGLFAALLLDLSAIATITSTIFTIIYIFVLISHFRLTKEFGGNRIIIAFNLTILLLVFGALMNYQWETQRSTFYISIATFIVAIFLEYLYRRIKGRKIKQDE
jgi:hypothetical protein